MSCLEISGIDWKNLSTHPSEYVRVDEKLRIKFQLLQQRFGTWVDGWTNQCQEENLKHQKLIYSMRCYLYHNGTRQFNCPILSEKELETLKQSRPRESTFLDHDHTELHEPMSEKEFMLLISETSDRLYSCKFYRKLVSAILCPTRCAAENKYLIEAIVSNYNVCLL